jgi:hypothetical protein
MRTLAKNSMQPTRQRPKQSQDSQQRHAQNMLRDVRIRISNGQRTLEKHMPSPISCTPVHVTSSNLTKPHTLHFYHKSITHTHTHTHTHKRKTERDTMAPTTIEKTIAVTPAEGVTCFDQDTKYSPFPPGGTVTGKCAEGWEAVR